MATLLEIAQIRTDAVLAQRVESAISTAAQYIVETEAANVPNARNRRKWAYDAMAHPASFSSRMQAAVAGNGTCQAAYVSTAPPSQDNIPDSDIQYVVNVMIDVFAGA
jgi:hypothetical protein